LDATARAKRTTASPPASARTDPATDACTISKTLAGTGASAGTGSEALIFSCLRVDLAFALSLAA